MCMAALALAAVAPAARGELVPCGSADVPAVAGAIARIEASRDPCGRSPEIAAILDTVRRCPTRYRICAATGLSRNELDLPIDEDGRPLPRTISWNPTLRTVLEPTSAAVPRDPTASLLHELAHAADDCRGLDPGEREMEAVSIENVYRRAAGLPQRMAYGDTPLPQPLVMECAPGRCPCSAPVHAAPGAGIRARTSDSDRAAGDAVLVAPYRQSVPRFTHSPSLHR